MESILAAVFVVGLVITAAGMGAAFSPPTILVVDSAQLANAMRRAAPPATVEPRPVVRSIGRDALATMSHAEVRAALGMRPPRDEQATARIHTVSFRIGRSDRSTISGAV